MQYSLSNLYSEYLDNPWKVILAFGDVSDPMEEQPHVAFSPCKEISQGSGPPSFGIKSYLKYEQKHFRCFWVLWVGVFGKKKNSNVGEG